MGRWKFSDEWTGSELDENASDETKARRKAVEADLREVIASNKVQTFLTYPGEPAIEASARHALDDFFFVDAAMNVVGQIDAPQVRFGCEFHRQQLEDFFSAASDGKHSSNRKRPGAPEKYKWGRIRNYMETWIEEHGYPKPEARLVEATQEWYIKNVDADEHPSAPPLYAEIKKFKK